MMNEPQEANHDTDHRWTLLRDIGALQIKLIVDGFRDLILVPASLIAGVLSLMAGGGARHELPFYRLLDLGKQSERWINLFGAAQSATADVEPPDPEADGDIDTLVDKFESFVVDEYKRGGVTAQAKQHFDKVLDALQRKNR